MSRRKADTRKEPVSASTRRVLVLGGVSYNTMVYLEEFPRPEPGTVFSRGFHETVGSTGVGKALALHKLGLVVTLYGLIGEDDFGRRVRDYLAREQIDFLTDIDPGGTKRHVNLMDRTGERISIFLVPGTFEPEVDPERLGEQIAKADYVALNIVNYCRRFIPLLKESARPVWCDLHSFDGQDPYYDDFIDAADVLFFSSGALPEYRRYMERWHLNGKELIVATHGLAGATALTAFGEWLEVPALTNYMLRDSNGAGDSFFAGVLYGLSEGADVQTALGLGAVVAGLCVTSSELTYPELSPTLVWAEYDRILGVET